MKTQLGKQTILFFSAQVLNALLGLATAYYLTSVLDATEWGRYTFLLSIVTIGSVVLDFGLNSAAKRLSAIAGETGERTVVASTLMFGLALGILFVAILAGFSLVLDSIFTNQSGSGAALLPILPFVLLYPAYENIQTLAQGMNRISLLSFATVFPRILFLIMLFMYPDSVRLSASTALALFLLSVSIATVAGAVYLKPSFEHRRTALRNLYLEIREFGIHMYYGRAVDGVMSGFDRLIITQFHGLQPTGFYGLAMTFVSPVSMFSRALSASAFKRFTVQPSIPQKTLYINAAGSVAAGIALVAGCITLLPVFFHRQYSDTLSVLPYLAAGAVLMGLNAPYHSFLMAKREGRALKIMSITTSGLNLALCALLIPFFSMMGGAIAFIATYGVNLAMNVYYYRNALRRIDRSGSGHV